jgi:hypothetical protein
MAMVDRLATSEQSEEEGEAAAEADGGDASAE